MKDLTAVILDFIKYSKYIIEKINNGEVLTLEERRFVRMLMCGVPCLTALKNMETLGVTETKDNLSVDLEGSAKELLALVKSQNCNIDP